MPTSAIVVECFGQGAGLGGKHTLALAFVLCSRLSTVPLLDEPACGAGAAASWEGFLETVEEDMMVVGIGPEIRDSRSEIRETRGEIDSSTNRYRANTSRSFRFREMLRYERLAVAETILNLYAFRAARQPHSLTATLASSNRFGIRALSFLGREGIASLC
jgi:hypothetical protein